MFFILFLILATEKINEINLKFINILVIYYFSINKIRLKTFVIIENNNATIRKLVNTTLYLITLDIDM